MRAIERGRAADLTVGGAVARFALAGVIALAIVGIVSFFVFRHIGTNEALEDARDLTEVVGNGIVEPNLTEGVVRGDPAALRRFDLVIRRRVLRDPIVRIKLWTATGRIVYSDKRALIGSRYELAADDLAALRSGEVESEVSDLSRPENRFERGRGKLLEVYMGIRAANGRPLLFEAYQEFDTVASSGRDIWLAFAPALIIALIVLELVQLPLASSMARRIRRGNEEREALLQRAVDASTAERRRIAGDLHDGIVQDLAGVSYSLAAAAQRSEADGAAAAALERGAEQTRQSVRELRGLLVELYPPRLQEAGLPAALTDLVAPAAGRGIETGVHVPEDLELPPEQEALLYRVAQEAVRNALKHADAERIDITVLDFPDRAALWVTDDGKGFDVEGNGAPEGHFGMRVLRDLAGEAGAQLEVESAPGEGTRVRIEVART